MLYRFNKGKKKKSCKRKTQKCYTTMRLIWEYSLAFKNMPKMWLDNHLLRCHLCKMISVRFHVLHKRCATSNKYGSCFQVKYKIIKIHFFSFIFSQPFILQIINLRNYHLKTFFSLTLEKICFTALITAKYYMWYF